MQHLQAKDSIQSKIKEGDKMKIQNKSAGMKYGDSNKSHVLAIKTIKYFWNKFCHPSYKDWIIDESWVEQYSEKFIHDNPDRNKDHWGHCPDLTFFQWFEDRPIPQLIIEVDGESHDSKTRQISDNIFEKWISQHYHDQVRFIRLQKAELELDLTLAHQYLWTELKEFLE